MTRARSRCAWLAAVFVAAPAAAFGPQGHLIAGFAAEPLLCAEARTHVAALGASLGELGLWADRVRSTPEYAKSAPWHYMNIEDGVPITAFEHPPEGDVLSAIDRFRAELAAGAAPEEEADALRFLIHFIVDVHQPLHVGRASDRGGNTINLRIGGAPTNLHRFWDSDAIDLAGLPLDRYAALVAERAAAAFPAARYAPREWAAESLALRAGVYDFGRDPAGLPERYIEFAIATTEDRLALAAARLAATLNGLYCH